MVAEVFEVVPKFEIVLVSIVDVSVYKEVDSVGVNVVLFANRDVGEDALLYGDVYFVDVVEPTKHTHF